MWPIFTGTRQWDASCYLDWQGLRFTVIFVAFLRNLGHILQSIDLHGYCIGKRPILVLKGKHRKLLSNTFFVELLSTRVPEKQIEPDLFRSHCFPTWKLPTQFGQSGVDRHTNMFANASIADSQRF